MARALQSVDEVLRDAEAALRAGTTAAAKAWPTGFSMLDRYLSGGFRSSELALLGGPQGLGKTTLALQMLRNAVAAGEAAVYFSYEHDAATVLERLLALEAGLALGLEAVPLRRIRAAMEATDGRSGTLRERLADMPGATEALRAVAGYAERLFIHRSSGALTGLTEISQVVDVVAARCATLPIVVIDYLQKVAVPDGPGVEEERVTMVVDGLKDLALARRIPVLAVVAAAKEGLVAGQRLRLHHLRGASALAYEADVVLLINDKYEVVARHHLVFDVSNAERFRDYVVLTIEKNRNGVDKVDMQLRKRFEQARYEVEMDAVTEQLVDERVFTT